MLCHWVSSNMFWMITVPSPSGSSSLLGPSDSENEGTMIPWNIGNYPPNNSVSHPIRFHSCKKHKSHLKTVLAVLIIWLMKNMNYRISHNAKYVDINPEMLEHSLQWKFWKMYFCTKRRLLLPYINKWTVCKEIFIMAYSLHWNYTACLNFLTVQGIS